MEAKQYVTKQPMDHQRKKSKRKSKKYLETNENENMMILNLRDAAKAVLRGKFTAIQSYLRKEKSLSNNLTTPKAPRERSTSKTQS